MKSFGRIVKKAYAKAVRLICRLHRDDEGVITILTVFAVLVLAMLLGMVMNMGRQVDSKLRMQNVADAVAYSGGVVIARGLNTLSFTNHLLFDVFALTAFLREGQARHVEPFIPDILAAWEEAGQMLAAAPFDDSSPLGKFRRLGEAIIEKVPLEQQLVTAYSNWVAAVAEQILPTMEQILYDEMIPRFQRDVLIVYPEVAQRAANEIARINSGGVRGEGRMFGVLWRTDVEPVGGQVEAVDRTLPVIDPVMDPLPDQARWLNTARQQRDRLAHRYLNAWNNEAMYFFDREAKMCQFAALWRSFTCGYLEQLLKVEYPSSNLPMLLYPPEETGLPPGQLLETDYTFVGVVYREPIPELMPVVYDNPLESDSVAFAAVRVFVPRRRLVWHYWHESGRQPMPIGGVPGDFPTLPEEEPPVEPPVPETTQQGRWYVGREFLSAEWNLLNQRWRVQLVPATCATLPAILQTVPITSEINLSGYTPPNLTAVDGDAFQLINTH